MRSHATIDDQIWNVWNLCSDAYLRHGRKLNLPAKTDPAKTYQWRYATSLHRKFAEWEFDDETAARFIDLAVRHSKQVGTMHKGLAALHQGNLLEICHGKLKAECDLNVQSIASLKHMREWVKKKINGRDPLTVMLDREDSDGFCNLVVWVQASRVTPLYLALSRVCGVAIARLNRDCPDERAFLPKQTELFTIRGEFLHDHNNLVEAREIFAQDWREPCLLPS